MTESQLQLGNNLNKDRRTVYEQMKEHITACPRKYFETEDCKEDFDEFKQDLLNQCDKWVETQKAKIDKKFSAI